jgi:hypothetical protein
MRETIAFWTLVIVCAAFHYWLKANPDEPPFRRPVGENFPTWCWFAVAAFFVALLFALSALAQEPASEQTEAHRQGPTPAPLSTCTGAFPCMACRNCSACKYCHVLGGKCGICSSKDPFATVDFAKDLDGATVAALRARQRAHSPAAQ